MKEVVRAIILSPDRKLLFGLRAEGSGMGNWAWFGGKPDVNECLQDAVVREVREETGLDFFGLSLWKVGVRDDWRTSYFEGQVRGEIILNKEHLMAKYFSLAEICERDDIAFGHRELAIQYLQERENEPFNRI